MKELSNENRELNDSIQRFDFKAKGLYFDLRLISTINDDWQKWKDELMGMTMPLFLTMYRLNRVFIQPSELNIFPETEQMEEEMYFRFFSDAGKVEVIFTLNPKTLEITYQRLQITKYEEVFSLFA